PASGIALDAGARRGLGAVQKFHAIAGFLPGAGHRLDAGEGAIAMGGLVPAALPRVAVDFMFLDEAEYGRGRTAHKRREPRAQRAHRRLNGSWIAEGELRDDEAARPRGCPLTETRRRDHGDRGAGFAECEGGGGTEDAAADNRHIDL